MKILFTVAFVTLSLWPFAVMPVNAEQLTLRMLIWDGYAPAEAQRSFQQIVKDTFDVDLEFQIEYASNPDEFFNKLRKGSVDLITPAHNVPKDPRYNLTKNGLTIPLNLENIPNYENLISELSRQSWSVEQDQIYAIPIVHGVYGLAYNSKKVKTPPDSWSIFWDPEYAGRYTVNEDYYELNVYITALAQGNKKEDIFQYDRIKGQTLEDGLHGLARHAKKLWRGFDQPEHYEDMALATTWRFTFPDENNLFADWRVAEPTEGTLWFIDTIMLSRTLKDQDLLRTIAEMWINFLLEPEIQVKQLAQKIGVCPVTTEALEIFSNEVLSLSERQRLDRMFDNLISWEILNTRSRNAFNVLWLEALTERNDDPSTQIDKL